MKWYFFICLFFSILYSTESENLFLKEYTVDNDGRIISWNKKNGVVLHYSYDSKDRLIELKSSDMSVHYIYKYDDSIDPVEIVDLIHNNKIIREYSNHLLVKEQTPFFNLQKIFDENQKLVETIYPDNSFTVYVYDDENLVEIKRFNKNEELLYNHKYNLSPSCLEESLINGLGSQLSYYKDGEIIEKSNPYFSFKVESLQNKKKFSSNFYETLYEFNEKKELVNETGLFNFSYGYDNKHNRIFQNEDIYKNNEKNELISQNNTLYSYDLNGNLAEEKSDRSFQYFYDALDRLTTIICNKMYKLEFAYDAFNRRISKTAYVYSNHCWQKYYERYFIYDNFNEIGSLNENGEIIELKVLGKQNAMSTPEPIAIELQHIPYTPIYDLRNNLCALVLNNKIVESYYYSAFGIQKIFDENFHEISKSKVLNPWGFCSKRKEEEVPLMFFGKRFYSPQIGRWITSDPCGLIDSSNVYTFALNDPINRIDLFGLSSFSIETQKLFYFLCRQTGKIASNFASLVEYLNNEIVAFPFLNKVFDLGANFIKFTYNPWEIDPYVYLLKPLGKDNSKIRLGYLNGICNICPQECIDSGHTIIEKIEENFMLDLYYSASQGCVIDYLECVFLKLNIETPNTERFRNLLRENLKKVPEDGKYILFVHSKSALIAKIAISQLSEKERAKIEIYASAPLGLLDKDLCSSVKNILSKDDGITVFNAYELLKSQFSNKIPLEWIDPIDTIFPCDHMYHSLSYQLRLKKQINDILERFNLTSENTLVQKNTKKCNCNKKVKIY